MNTASNIDRYRSWLSPKIGWGNRWEAMAKIGSLLIEKNKPVFVVETGCARRPGAWIGDGQSTMIWDYIVEMVGGSVTSFDISEEAILFTKRNTKHVNAVCIDSITGIRGIPNKSEIDLLFLDSYDVTNDYRSPLHHFGELASAYEGLKSGCIIAIDDCGSGKASYGKDRYVSAFLNEQRAENIITSYISAWIKP